MNFKDIPIIKSDERGTIFDCDQLRVVMRKKGTISANHSHEDPEILYLIQGEAEFTIDAETEKIIAPVMIEIEENRFHKIVALSDIILLYKRDFPVE